MFSMEDIDALIKKEVTFLCSKTHVLRAIKKNFIEDYIG